MLLSKCGVLTLVSFLALLSGCGINDRVSYSDEEGRLSEKLLTNISKPGTEKSVILGNLGLPQSVDTFSLDDNGHHFEVYNYRVTEKQVRLGHLFYVFKMSAMESNAKYFHVVLRDDQVEKTWFDEIASGKIAVRNHQTSSSSEAMHKQAKLQNTAAQPSMLSSPMSSGVTTSKKVYVLPDNMPEDTSVELQTKSGPVSIETQKTSKFEWKVPILKKWFGPKDDKKMDQDQQAPMSESNKMENDAANSVANSTINQEMDMGANQQSSASNAMSETPNATSTDVVVEGEVEESAANDGEQ